MKMFDKNKDGRLDLNDLARYCSNCFTFWHQRVFLHPFCSNACSTFSWGWHRGGGEDGKSWGTYYMTHYRWQKLYKQHWGGQHILGGMAPAPPWWHPCHFIGHFLCFDRSASLCSFVFVTLLVTVLSLFMMFLHVFLFCFHFLLFCFKIFSFFCPCIPIESLTKAFEGLKIFIGFYHISIWQKSVSFLQNFGLKRKFPAEVQDGCKCEDADL